MTPGEALDASVVIPCRAAEDTLPRQLAALAAQEWEGRWEVIVADNGPATSSEDMAALIESWGEKLPRLRRVDAADRVGAAHARNVGAAKATGRLILFCDADDEVHPGWLAAMARALETEAFVACRYDVERLNSERVRRARENPQGNGLNPYTYPPFLPHAGGGSLGIRRDLHHEIGGFDETLRALEDTDYCWRLQLAGIKLHFAADAVVSIRLPQTLGEVFRQARLYGEYNVLLYKRYRGRGMPRLAPWLGLWKLARLVATVPMVLIPTPRAAWVWQLGWRLGRVKGCFAYRVWAL